MCLRGCAADVVLSHLPGGRAVKYVRAGSVGRLPQAWPALFVWCASQGLKLQVYGATAADPASQETTLYASLA